VIPLSATGLARGVTNDLLGRVSLVPLPESERRNVVRVLVDRIDGEPLDGYIAVVTPGGATNTNGTPAVFGCRTNHLETGDVVSINRRGYVRTLYRRSSKSNTLFATDRCNSLCLMCSQPPREVDDTRRASELIRLVGLVNPATEELGITGGEPTLLGEGLLDVIAACRDRLPQTAIHLLSNGRRFYYGSYARALGALRHPDLMVGVPVYSDLDVEHDYVVQAKGAFSETIQGLHNLTKADVRVEIRVVVHRQTYRRLPELAEYIFRNLTFASHVTFMGLEVIGLAKANIASLWIDPVDYAAELEAAVLKLATAGLNVSIYNHQFCTIPESLWRFSRRSISDWKNEYADECTICAVRDLCGGFFSWNLQEHRSRCIRPIVASE
jgi:His-Xaa-Ser system radical SAM maturase HxsC